MSWWTPLSLEPMPVQRATKKTRQKMRSWDESRGFSTKIPALTDVLGNPLKFIATPGQRQEITQANAMIVNVFESTVLGDKGSDPNTRITQFAKPRWASGIPSRKNRKKPRE